MSLLCYYLYMDHPLSGKEIDIVPNNSETFVNLLNYAGNDERKLLILLSLNDSDQALGKTELYRKLEEKCDQNIPGDLSAPFQFCQSSLVKAGLVQPKKATALKFGKYPMEVSGFEITQHGKELGVPFAGALLEWSLNNPNLSLDQVLGHTGGNFDARAPYISYSTLYDLVTSPENPSGPSIVNLNPEPGISYKSSQNAIDRFKQVNIVDVESSFHENKRQFRIITPKYIEGERKRSFENLKEETKILFRSFEAAYKVKDLWGQDEFLRLVNEINPNLDENTVKNIRIRLENALAPQSYNLNGVIEDVSGKIYEGSSKVSLKAEKQTAVEKLVTIIDQFSDTDSLSVDKYITVAEAIYDDTNKVSSLYNKGYENSNQAVTDEKFERRIINIIRSSGELATTASITKEYSAESGRKINPQTVRSLLNDLISRDVISYEVLPKSKLKQQPVRHYSVVGPKNNLN